MGHFTIRKYYIIPGIQQNGMRFILGIFNGDGKADLLTKTGGSWYTSYSTGTSYHTVGFSPNYAINTSSSSQYLRIGDFNGDGRHDILHTYNVGGTQSSQKLYLSTGFRF